MNKIFVLIGIVLSISCGENKNTGTSSIDTTRKDSVVSSEPLSIEDGIIVYQGDTFYSREKALQISQVQKKKVATSACDNYIGSWTKNDGTLLVIENQNGSYFAALSHRALGKITDWYLKCGVGEYPELVPIGSGSTLVLLPSGELEMHGRGDGKPFHRK